MSIQDQDLIHPVKSGKTFECPEISKKISKNLQILHATREFFDLILIGSDGIQIRAHCIILETSTQYFSETFRSIPKPNTKKPMEIEVKDFQSGILDSVLQFIYTGSVDFCIETVHQVLGAANHFKIQPLMDLCFIFIMEEVNSSNCLNTVTYAKENDYMQLYKDSFSFACNHFEEICSGIDFLKLDEKMVDDILSSNEVVVSSEDKIVQSLLMWLEHDRKNREENWKQRLSNVRYQFLTNKFILENTSAICIDIDCHKLIRTWLKWHIFPEKRKFVANSRKGYRTAKLNLVTGYFLDDLTVQTYYPEFNTWTYKCIKTSWDNLYSISTIVDKGVVIIAGGIKEDRTRTKELKCFNIETEEEWLLPCMRKSRSSSGIAILNGYLYVIGGNGLKNKMLRSLTSVERYNFSERKWEDVAPLLEPMVNDGKIAILNDCLYIIDSNTTQCYNTKDNSWSYKALKKNECRYFGLVSCGKYLFTIGGRLQNGLLTAAVERYNPLSDTWDAFTSLKSPLELSQCLVFKNSFIVVGGIFNSDWINTVNEYNTETNEWKTLAPLLINSLSIQVVPP